MDGEGRWARYRMPDAAIDAATREDADEPDIPLSTAGKLIRDYVSQAPQARKPVGYDRNFLDRYRPNSSSYLSEKDRTHLATVGCLQIDLAASLGGEVNAMTLQQDLSRRLVC